MKNVLHVGSGPYIPHKLHASFRNDDWTETRLDIDPGVKPDIVCDMTDMSVVDAAGFDAVWSSHNLEHVFAHQVQAVLSEFHRVLLPGGHVLLNMPDLQRVCEQAAHGDIETPLYQSPAGPISLIDIVYGFHKGIASGNHFMAHKTGFSAQTLGNKLQAAGFHQIIIHRCSYDLWAQAHKLDAQTKAITEIKIIDDGMK